MSTTRTVQPRIKRERLPGIPRRPLTPEQQLEALHKAQAQAEQRVQLGVKLFRAAEERLSAQQELTEQLKAEAQRLREQVNAEVEKKLCDYDQWVTRIDVTLTAALDELDKKVNAIADDRQRMCEQVEQLTKRCESMLDQCRRLLEQAGPRPRQAAGDAPDGENAIDDHLYTSILRKLRNEDDPPIDKAA